MMHAKIISIGHESSISKAEGQPQSGTKVNKGAYC
jgi:hypothetical protein